MKRITRYAMGLSVALSGLAAALPALGQYTPGYQPGYGYAQPPIYAPQPQPQVAGYAYALTPAQHAAWVKAMHPVWAKFTDKIGKDIVDAAVASNGPKTN